MISKSNTGSSSSLARVVSSPVMFGEDDLPKYITRFCFFFPDSKAKQPQQKYAEIAMASKPRVTVVAIMTFLCLLSFFKSEIEYARRIYTSAPPIENCCRSIKLPVQCIQPMPG
nr:hypothetical protein Iba_scaffold30513CG0010 [Ipomoea batatas]GMC53226.1 hypothetical protein Iba_scaffold30514CG0010 [Ipomoea batatas]GMD28054.1 hypothetical protein Iba_scaffold43134CG0010 [Ipomoea batatas]